MIKRWLNWVCCIRLKPLDGSNGQAHHSGGISSLRNVLPPLIIGLCLVCCTAGRAVRVNGQEQGPKANVPIPASSVSQDDVRPILRELDSELLETRDGAEKRLVALGPGVLRWLPEIKPNTSGEMKVRLLRIREQLQQQGIASYFEASTITLNGKFKLSEAVSQISEQTGNAIELRNADGAADTEIEISANNAKFWDVMQSVLKLAKLSIDANTPSNALILIPDRNTSDDVASVVTVNGPFMFNVVQTQTNMNLQAPSFSRLNVSILVTWEPRLKPVFLRLPMKQFAAEVEGGITLDALEPMATPEYTVNSGSCSMQLDIPLAKPPRSMSQLTSFRGEMEFAIPGEKESFVFDKFVDGRAKSVKHGDVNMVLEAGRNNQLYEFRIRVDFNDTAGVLDSFRNWMQTNNAYLLDDKGNRFEAFSNSTFATRTNSAGVSFIFQINGDPSKYKLMYDFPITISRQNITFELKDIPLP